MRRSLFLLGLSAFAALVSAAWTGEKSAWILCAVCGMAGSICGAAAFRAARGTVIFRGRNTVSLLLTGTAALLTASLSFFLFAFRWHTAVAPLEALIGTKGRIHGVVLDYPAERDGVCRCLVRVERVETEAGPAAAKPFTLRLSASLPFSAEPSDTLDASVTFFGFGEGGLYSSRNTWLAKGVALGAYPTEGEVKVLPQAGQDLRRFFAGVRHRAVRGVRSALPPEEAAMIEAMLLGERDELSDSAYRDFKLLGVSHLLVISGLHLGILAGLFSFLFRRAPFGRVGRDLLLALLILGFLAVTAFPVSGVRSGVMLLLFLLADCLDRQADSINSLGFAVLCICVGNPFAGADLGFALSALATLGILTLAPRLRRAFLSPFREKRRLARLMKPVCGSLAATVSAMLFTLPIQILVFRYVPLLAPLANLLLVLPCTLLLYCGFGAVLFGSIPGLAPLAQPFLFCGGWLAKLSLWIAHLLAKLPRTGFSVGSLSLLMAAGGVLGFLLLAVLGKKGKAVRLAAGLMALLLLLLTAGYDAWRRRDVVTVAVAREEGSRCVAVVKNREGALLSLGGYDTGAAEKLLRTAGADSLSALYAPGWDSKTAKAVRRLTLRPESSFLPEALQGGRQTLGKLTGREPELVKPGESFPVLDGMEAFLSGDGQSLSFSANGIPVTVELGESKGGVCAVLITPRTDSRINSSFTVLQGNAIIDMSGEEETEEALSAGGPGTVFLDVLRDGTIQMRRES